MFQCFVLPVTASLKACFKSVKHLQNVTKLLHRGGSTLGQGAPAFPSLPPPKNPTYALGPSGIVSVGLGLTRYRVGNPTNDRFQM